MYMKKKITKNIVKKSKAQLKFSKGKERQSDFDGNKNVLQGNDRGKAT